MIKRLVEITQCYVCPHQKRTEKYDGESGEFIVTGAICELKGRKLDYINYCGLAMKDKYAFPKWCPLDKVKE